MSEDTNGTDAGGTVDRYLDELFDRLGGTGAAGRRALAEAEDHLRAAADAEKALGVSAEQAERNAVTRFGRPAHIARELRRTHRSLASALSGVWATAGLLLVLLAGTHLVKAVEMAVLLRMHSEPMPACGMWAASLTERLRAIGVLIPPSALLEAGPCNTIRPAIGASVWVGLVTLALAAAVLLVRKLAVRAGLGPTSPRYPPRVAALFALAALVMLILKPLTLVGWRLDDLLFLGIRGPGLHHNVIAAGLLLLAAIAAVVRHQARAGRPRYNAGPAGGLAEA